MVELEYGLQRQKRRGGIGRGREYRNAFVLGGALGSGNSFLFIRYERVSGEKNE